MPPAARLTDLQASPTGSGPLPAGAGAVQIGGLPAARAGDTAGSGGVIASGSPTVFIGGKPATRVGDKTAGGGVILTGIPTVIIGDAMTVDPKTLVGGDGGSGAGGTSPAGTPGTGDSGKAGAAGSDQQEAAGSKAGASKDDELVEQARLSVLGAPSTFEVATAIIELGQDYVKKMGEAIPPGLRASLVSFIEGAQQALQKMQIAALNQMLDGVRRGLDEAQQQMPVEDKLAAAAEAAAPPGAPGVKPPAVPKVPTVPGVNVPAVPKPPALPGAASALPKPVVPAGAPEPIVLRTPQAPSVPSPPAVPRVPRKD